MHAVGLDAIEDAILALAAGGAVVVVDDADRENEGDLVFAADAATPDLVAFTVRHTSGVLCAALPGETADRLDLPPMTLVNDDPKQTAYTVTCDASSGITTGISAADRAVTLQALASPRSGPSSFTRPGHVFPLRAVRGGVRERRGHTEASVELCRLAGREPVGVIAELVHDSGEMMRLPALREFSDTHRLPLVSIDDLSRHLDQTTPSDHRTAEAGVSR